MAPWCRRTPWRLPAESGPGRPTWPPGSSGSPLARRMRKARGSPPIRRPASGAGDRCARRGARRSAWTASTGGTGSRPHPNRLPPVLAGDLMRVRDIFFRTGASCAPGDGIAVPDGVECPRPQRDAPGRVECPRGWCAVGWSGQGESHLVPGHAAVVGGGQALVDETQARVEGHKVVKAGEHQALAAVDARCLNDGAQ